MNRKPEIQCDEEKILKTIQCAKDAFYEGEAARPLSRRRFLHDMGPAHGRKDPERRKCT